MFMFVLIKKGKNINNVWSVRKEEEGENVYL